MVPPNVAQYFLKKKSASDKQIKDFVKENFSMFPFVLNNKVNERMTPHEADSLLILYSCNRDYFMNNFGVSLRSMDDVELIRKELN